MYSGTVEMTNSLATSHQMLTLHDVYEPLEDNQTSKTSYVLQTLWKDLSSDYDIIGLYCTSEGDLKSKVLVAYIYDAMCQFHQFNFRVVCDGMQTLLPRRLCATEMGHM